jgi:hypothetical protein
MLIRAPMIHGLVVMALKKPFAVAAIIRTVL